MNQASVGTGQPAPQAGPNHWVETVEGRVPASGVGFALTHEHLVYALLGWQLDPVSRPSRRSQLEACVAAIRPAVEAGITTIVDMTTADCGRDVDLLRAVAGRSGVQIVCATGLYARRPTPYFSRRSVEELEHYFGREAEVGIGRSHVKPGVIKCAVDGPSLNDHEAAALTACANVARRARIPLVVHVEPGGAPAVLEATRRSGLPGHQLVIAHGESADLGGLLAIVQDVRAYVGFDRFGFEISLNDAERVAKVAALCRRGHADRILLSHDTIGLFLGRDRDWAAGRRELRNWNFGHLTGHILSAFAEAGIAADAVRTMTHLNPRRFLSLGG